MSVSKRSRETKQRYGNFRKQTHISHAINYRNSESWNSKLNAFNGSKKSVDRPDGLFLAQAAFELAVTAYDKKAQNDLLVESAERTTKLMSDPQLTPEKKVRASIMYSNFPLMNSVYVEKIQPNITTVEKTHKKLAGAVLNCSYKELEKAQERMEVAGALAEAYSLIFFQRFQTNVLKSEDWVAVPSLLSQDTSRHIGSGIRHAWDISVFTGKEQSQLESPTYRAQIKTRKDMINKSYGSGINVVYLRDDTKLPFENRIPSLSLIGLAACSHIMDAPEAWLTTTSDTRAELLVDALDR